MPHLPERIHRLDELARNVWWSWTPDARTVFRALDYGLWRTTAHNPMLMVRAATPEMLSAAMANPAWLQAYDRSVAALDALASPADTWTAKTHPELSRRTRSEEHTS